MKTKKTNKANLENKKSTFFLIGLVLSLGMVLLAFEWKTSKTSETITLGATDFVPEDFVFIPSTPNEKKELPKPVIEVPKLEIVDDQTDIINELDFSGSDPDDIELNINELVFTEITETPVEEPEILFFVDVMPEFPGGDQALLSYLSRNVKYPVIAQENGIQGKVYVSFVIDEKGRILRVELLRGVDSSLDNEAMRVVRNMPRWKPGKQSGKTVKVRYNVPINFELR
jgi:protein TonB